MTREICCCGHPKDCHEDRGVFDKWGEGSCDKCKCKEFLDKNYRELKRKADEKRNKKETIEIGNCNICGKTLYAEKSSYYNTFMNNEVCVHKI